VPLCSQGKARGKEGRWVARLRDSTIFSPKTKPGPNNMGAIQRTLDHVCPHRPISRIPSGSCRPKRTP